MKINLIRKLLSKSLLLASAIVGLTFSTANAVDYYSEESEYTTYHDLTDYTPLGIYVNAGAHLVFSNSLLGHSAYNTNYIRIGEQVMGIFEATLSLETGTTVFVNQIDLTQGIRAYLFLENNVTLYFSGTFNNYADDFQMKIMNNSLFSINYHLSNEIRNLTLSDSTIELGFWTASHNSNSTLTLDNLALIGTNTILYNLSELFIAEVYAGAGYFDIYTDTVVCSYNTYGSGTLEHYIPESVGNYVWTVTHIGGDGYRIENITMIIPEPSTYAMIFGVLALGLAIYRRK